MHLIISLKSNILMIKIPLATLCTDTYSGGVPSKSKFSNSSFTRSFSLAMNVKVHCWITLSGFRNTGALKLPFFDFARLVDSNVISQAEKKKMSYLVQNEQYRISKFFQTFTRNNQSSE